MAQQHPTRKPSPQHPRRPQPTQHRTPPPQHHESDLQPVYDVLDSLQPSHLRAAWHRTNRRTRWLMVFMIAGVILLWSVMRISIMVANHIDETSGPFLWEALRAPYNLEARLIPTIDLNADPETITVLPATIGEFTLQPEVALAEEETSEENVEQAAPEAVVEAATSETLTEAASAPVAEAPVVVYPVSDCLYAGGTPVDKAACVRAEAQFIESGTYQNIEGTTIRVTAAVFASDYEATQVAKDLHRYAFSIGSVGNFALDLGQVDYFYSSIPDQYTFVWSHGSWVYTASGPVFDDMENLVQTFPY